MYKFTPFAKKLFNFEKLELCLKGMVYKKNNFWNKRFVYNDFNVDKYEITITNKSDCFSNSKLQWSVRKTFFLINRFNEVPKTPKTGELWSKWTTLRN